MNRPKNIKDIDHIETLYKMLTMPNFPMERIADWMAVNGLKYSNQLVARTFKMAGREDLKDIFIEEEDIKIGSIVRSRYTGRIGEVIEMKADGHSIVVKWDTGGSQPLSKESVFKLRNKNIDSPVEVSDFKKPYTKYDNYGDINK
jgi:hypothetical protein